MAHRTDQQQQQPSPAPLTPRPNPILAEPATPQACAEDYAAGADVRRAMDQQQQRGRA
jgi:hypothetical protein